MMDWAPAVRCTIEYVDAVEIVDPENINEAVVTCGIKKRFWTPRKDVVTMETDRTEMPDAIDTLDAADVGASTELDPSEMETVDTAAAALINSLAVVTVSELPTSENTPMCAEVTETVVSPLTVELVPISVTEPAPPPN